jgi:NADH:ubiquinone oxidoreductase subunit K
VAEGQPSASVFVLFFCYVALSLGVRGPAILMALYRNSEARVYVDALMALRGTLTSKKFSLNVR